MQDQSHFPHYILLLFYRRWNPQPAEPLLNRSCLFPQRRHGHGGIRHPRLVQQVVPVLRGFLLPFVDGRELHGTQTVHGFGGKHAGNRSNATPSQGLAETSEQIPGAVKAAWHCLKFVFLGNL